MLAAAYGTDDDISWMLDELYYSNIRKNGILPSGEDILRDPRIAEEYIAGAYITALDEYTKFLGGPRTMVEGGEAIENGAYLTGAGLMALGAVEMVPGVGKSGTAVKAGAKMGMLARIGQGFKNAAQGIKSFLTKGKGGPATAQAGEKLLAYSGKLADHHVMPRQFENFFKKAGINIDNYTVTLDHNITHLKGVHGAGNMGQMPGRWNQIWSEWIGANPKATAKEIFQQAGKMMDDFGLGHLRIHPYGK
jgi:hypothetical protein